MTFRSLRILTLCVVIFALSFYVVLQQKKAPGNTPDIPAKLKASFAYQAAKWYNDQRAFPAGTIPVDWKTKALQHIQKFNINNERNVSEATQLSWISLGPNNIGGRIRSILIHPTHPDTMYCGSVSGGIWKTTNGGASWVPTSDQSANLAIGTMVLDPQHPDTIYAGTGEGYFNIDALRGAGVLKSTNGGASWTLLTNFSNPNSRYSYYYINKLIIRPDNPNVLYAAMIGGVWKTTNGGAQWSKLNVPSSSYFCMDLVANPNNPDIMIASFGLFPQETSDGIYKTTDGGTSWSKIESGWPATFTKYTRTSLAFSPSDPNIVYASLSDSNFYTHSILRSSDGGNSWFTKTIPVDNSLRPSASHLGGQGFYNNLIVVHPTNSNIVYAGGIDLMRSTNGGGNWSMVTDVNNSNGSHVDQHALVFHPNDPNILFSGNDGGIYKSTNGGAVFSSLNNNLTITQYYSVAADTTGSKFLGGTQDNGTLIYSGNGRWDLALSGDGGPVWIDYQNPRNVYLSYVYLWLWKSTDGGTGSFSIMNGIPRQNDRWTSDRCSFIAPFTMDPSTPSVLLAGTYRIFRTSNGGANWSAVTGDLTGSGVGQVGESGSTITAIEIAKSNSSYIYVGTSGWGTDVKSRVIVTTNNFGSQTVSSTSPLPNRDVTDIAVDPLDANRAVVTYSGYNSATPSTPGHIFITTTHGTAWANISGDLPDIPANTIIIDPSQRNHFIIGTDLGIFETTNGGGTWLQENSGLANVAISDLDLRQDGFVIAATHGRGIFRTSSDLYSGLSLLSPANSSTNQSTAITLKWKSSSAAVSFRLRISTDPNFATGIIFDDSTIVEDQKTVSGLAQNTTYYWQITSNRAVGAPSSSPIWSFTTVPDYPSSFAISASISFPTYTDVGEYAPEDYRLVGLPGMANFKIDSLLSGSHKSEWQLYWDNGASSNYLIEYDGSSKFRFSEGKAFWLLHKGNISISGTVPSVPIDTAMSVSIPLHSGWNLIANPYPFSITWASIKNANGISEPIYGFSGNFSQPSVFEPYKGYYFFNSSNSSSLIVPYGNTNAKQLVLSNDADLRWKVGIQLTTSGYVDNIAYFGISQKAEDGFDRLDFRRPHGVGASPSVFFDRSTWDAQFNSFTSDVRKESEKVQVWNFTVQAKAGKSAVLAFDGIEQIPAGASEEFDEEAFEHGEEGESEAEVHGVYLVDVERGKIVNLRKSATYRFLPEHAEEQFKIIVGPEEEITSELHDVKPQSFSVSDNYPNPFNPATTFEYRLAQPSMVSFILYNIAGKEVATLVSGQQEAGTYSISWNAGEAASGVYIAVFRAGKFIATKKILLMK